MLGKGLLHNTPVNGGNAHVKNTRKEGYSCENALMGMDGEASAGATQFTAAELQQSKRKGWGVLTIKYVDYAKGNQVGHRHW